MFKHKSFIKVNICHEKFKTTRSFESHITSPKVVINLDKLPFGASNLHSHPLGGSPHLLKKS